MSAREVITDWNFTLYWYSPSRIVRLPISTSALRMAASSSAAVMPAWRSLPASGMTRISGATAPLMSTIATSGSCSMRLTMTCEAKRLSSAKRSETGCSSSAARPDLAGPSPRTVRLM